VAKKVKLYLSIIAIALLIIIFMLVPDRYSKIIIIINQGETLDTISSKLKNNHLIISRNLFIKLVDFTGASKKLKAGIYSFSCKDNMITILKTLRQGSNDNIKITVPEGSTIKQIANIISQKIPIDEEKIIKIATMRNLEGYLMPDTYFVVPGIDEEQIIDMMYNEFNKRITPSILQRAREINMDFRDIVILASIIEKEAANSEERSIISAVFYNRLKKKLRLQSCATVLYAMGRNKEKLSIKDTKFKSPYNTYLHYGLPPGPICSPGSASINAALYPANVKSLFFVSKGDGKHLFSDDLKEHNKNKQEVSKNK
jgi:UPF0755 protein